MAAVMGACPICEAETEGIHIAGTVYDFQCDSCVEEADAGFQSFVDALVAEAISDPGTPGDAPRGTVPTKSGSDEGSGR